MRALGRSGAEQRGQLGLGSRLPVLTGTPFTWPANAQNGDAIIAKATGQSPAIMTYDSVLGKWVSEERQIWTPTPTDWTNEILRIDFPSANTYYVFRSEVKYSERYAAGLRLQARFIGELFCSAAGGNWTVGYRLPGLAVANTTGWSQALPTGAMTTYDSQWLDLSAATADILVVTAWASTAAVGTVQIRGSVWTRWINA
jgi:hypothetical protein